MEALRQAGYPVIVAHFNHQLRPDSDMEANALEKTVSRKMIASIFESGDVRGYAESEGLSIEEAARTLRYRFLFEQARECDAQAVAVGHTADDQVETVLMHFLRGAGLTGLKGMSYRSFLPVFDESIPVVRPLLDIWREETVLYCAANGLRPYYDPSNDSLNFLRNRIRHLLIPQLETYNPRFREALWRTAHSLAGDYSALIELLDATWGECVKSQRPGLITFDAAMISSYAPGLAAQPDPARVGPGCPGCDRPALFGAGARIRVSLHPQLRTHRSDRGRASVPGRGSGLCGREGCLAAFRALAANAAGRRLVEIVDPRPTGTFRRMAVLVRAVAHPCPGVGAGPE